MSIILSTEIKTQLFETRLAQSRIQRFTNKIDDTYLDYEMYWVPDVAEYDIHIRDVSEQCLAQIRLEHMAYHNSLTGLKNQSCLEKDKQPFMSSSTPFSLLLIEVTQYKILVGNNGLTSALESMRAFAMALEKRFDLIIQKLGLSQDNRLYHIADANFVVFSPLLNHTPQLDSLVNELSNYFTGAIAKYFGIMRMGSRIGITEFPRSSATLKEQLLHANIALGEASLKNMPYCYFDRESGDQHERRLSLIKHLKLAISNEAFTLYFQPKIDVSTQKTNTCECLIRWFTEDGNSISPAQFIPLAETSGLILPLGEWILDAAFTQAKSWFAQCIDMCVAINISPRQFSQPDFVNGIRQRLKDHELPARYIELEITETVIMDDQEFGIQVLSELKQLGVSLSIDDFGTGYSSLAYLKHFPVDKLKIDQSFIRNMENNKQDQAIVLSLCQLARNLNLSVIAEGVEEQAQFDLLRSYHCDQVQGYLISRPLAVANFEQFLQERLTAIKRGPSDILGV
jgi:EAL domain-containing protein (putative c-di-GMP-specific phosphodiesterase class I)/GGDEF domain-containing protein